MSKGNTKERNSSPEAVAAFAHHKSATASIFVLSQYTKEQLDILFATKRKNKLQLKQGKITVCDILGFLGTMKHQAFHISPYTIGGNLCLSHKTVCKWMRRLVESSIILKLAPGKWRSNKEKSMATTYRFPTKDGTVNIIKDLIKIHKKHIEKLEDKLCEPKYLFQPAKTEDELLFSLNCMYEHKRKITHTMLELELGLDEKEIILW